MHAQRCRRARDSRHRSDHPDARRAARARAGFAAAGPQGAARGRFPAPPTRSRSRSSRVQCAQRKRLLAVVSADALVGAAPRRRDPVVRARRQRRAAARTGRRCRTIQFSPHHDLVSERLATLYRVSRGECDVLVVAATTALYRLAPPSYLAAFTFFLEQGDAPRRRRAARAAGARRLPARHAGRVARRIQHPRRPDRPLSDGQHAALSASISSATTSRASRPSTSTRSARSTRCRTCGCCPRASFRSTRRAARAFAAAIARCSKAIRRSSPLYKDVSNGVAPGGIEYYLPLFFEATATLADYLPQDAAVALHGDVAGRDRALLAGHRLALPAAARRQGAPAAAADRSLPARRRVQRDA